MDLDKYRRTPPAPAEELPAPASTPQPQAPALGRSADQVRQQANRYRHFVHPEVATEQPTEAEPPQPAPTSRPVDEPQNTTEPANRTPAKGNTFKSDGNPATTRQRKQSVPTPTAPKKREPSSQTGIKLVYLEETMREEYIQIAGYLMLKHRVKLTMTAYFCFLHEQAVTQQSDETFLATLAQFVKREGSTTNR